MTTQEQFIEFLKKHRAYKAFRVNLENQLKSKNITFDNYPQRHSPRTWLLYVEWFNVVKHAKYWKKLNNLWQTELQEKS